MIEKSSRHSKIIGNFGEQYIANWLSRSGFEVILVDHTGIDIVVYNKKMNKRFGISVKSRTRNEGTESTFVNIFHDNISDRKKVLEACDAFACEPWIGIYIETSEAADIYLLSLDHYDKTYSNRPDSKSGNWKMDLKNKQKYEEDNAIKHIKIQFDLKKWDWVC
jgi:Holliday junction resolvase